MKIIELYGIPGSGKSTITEKIINRLKKNGNKIFCLEDYLNVNSKLLTLKGFFSIDGQRFILGMLSEGIGKGFFKDKMRVKRAVFCLSLIGFYKKRHDADYIVLDEGVIQGFVSALFNWKSTFGLKWLAKVMKSCGVCCGFIATTPKTANRRLVKRNTPGHGRCDRIEDDEARLEILRIQYRRFFRIYRYADKLGVYSFKVESGEQKEIENIIDKI